MNPDHRVLFENDDGTVSVIVPAPAFIAQKLAEGLSSEQVTTLVKTAVPSNKRAGSLVVHKNTLPASRVFRKAWCLEAGDVTVNMPVARGLKMAEIRKKRDELLVESDKETLRLDAVGTEQQKKDIQTYRQALRDLPVTAQAAVDACDAADALEAYWPDWGVL